MDNELKEMLTAMNQNIITMGKDIKRIDDKVDTLSNKVETISSDMEVMRSDMAIMRTDINRIDTNVTELKQRVTRIELTLENEVIPSIKRVAEGHFDLHRNLSNIQASIEIIEGKNELYDIYLKHHSNEIRKLQPV